MKRERERKRKEELEGETAEGEDARVWHHLRTAGSAIIPRPFEFSSFVITTNMRQMKRAKDENGKGREMEEVARGRERRAAEKSG